MTAFTSKATGNHSSAGQTTWNEVGVPGDGDTETVGAHVVTVDVNTTVGHSPAAGDGTAAILLNNSSGGIVIATGVTLTCRGDYRKAANTCKIALNAGGKFQFDASAAGTPSTARYVATTDDHSRTGPLIEANGTSGSRCEISSVAGSAFGRITAGGFIGGSLVEAEFCDFKRLGDSANPAMNPWVASGHRFELADCTFDECGEIDCATNSNAAGHFILDRVKFANTTRSLCLDYNASSALTTGTRRIDACVFDKTIQLFSPISLTFTNNYLHAGFTATDAAWTSFDGNFVRDTSSNTINVRGSVTGSYFLEDHSNANPHFITPNGDRDMTVSGCVFEYTGTGGGGDCILLSNPTNPRTLTITNNILLPNAGGEDSGTLFSSLGGDNNTVVCNHNTCFAGVQGANVGENYAGHAGLVSSFKSNIMWGTGTGWKLRDLSSSVADIVSASNADYNCGHGLADDYPDLDFSSGTPGANDVDVDPQFVDATRDLASWDGSLGGAGTVAAALTRLQADPTLTASSLIPYIQDGFAPTNSLLEDAGHDGVTIGAVEGVFGPAPASSGATRLRIGIGIGL